MYHPLSHESAQRIATPHFACRRDPIVHFDEQSLPAAFLQEEACFVAQIPQISRIFVVLFGGLGKIA